MEYIENKQLGEGFYTKTLSNGLPVFVYPMKNKTSVHAMFSAKIGSIDRRFSLGDKRVVAPAGTAHFLEHKLFENADGQDAFSLFAKTGASANAYTSFDKTCYLFTSSFEHEQSLRTLLGFVSAPHFTDATVQKEQGIIGQEIKMYLDAPDWQLLFGLFECLYKNHPIKDDIAGSVESIAEITPQLLYDCCAALYRPSNMALCVAGDIEPARVFEIAEDMMRDKRFSELPVASEPIDEPAGIVSDYFETRMEVFSPQFCVGYKETPFPAADRIKNELLCDIIIDVAAGDTSDLFREMYDEGLVNNTFSTETISGESYLCHTFSGESPNPKEVLRRIEARLAELRESGVPQDRFEESRRAYLGDALIGFDSVDEVATNLTYAHFKNAEIFDIINALATLKHTDAQALLKAQFDPARRALAVVLPKN